MDTSFTIIGVRSIGRVRKKDAWRSCTIIIDNMLVKRIYSSVPEDIRRGRWQKRWIDARRRL